MAHYDFTRNNIKDILQVADDVYQSTRPATAAVAAIAAAPTFSTPPPNTTPEAMNQAFICPNNPGQAQVPAGPLEVQVAQLAALYQNLSSGRRGRGNRSSPANRGRGRGGGNRGARGARTQYSAQNPRHTTPRHPDLPPYGVCKRHWTYGKQSFCCLEPQTCEWKNFIKTD